MFNYKRSLYNREFIKIKILISLFKFILFLPSHSIDSNLKIQSVYEKIFDMYRLASIILQKIFQLLFTYFFLYYKIEDIKRIIIINKISKNQKLFPDTLKLCVFKCECEFV